MGKVALFAIAAFAVMGGYYSTSAQRGMISAASGVAEHQYQALVRSAALVGVNLAKQQLSENFGNTATVSGSYEGAAYTATISTSGALRSVRSEGALVTPDGDTARYIVSAQLDRLSRIPEQAPGIFQYALISEGDLTFNGDTSTDTVGTAGSASNVYNASVHTNGTLRVNGNKVRVRGFGTYVVNENVHQEHVTFKPYTNPTGEPVLQQVAPYDLAGARFHPDSMEAQLVEDFDKPSGVPDRTTYGDEYLSGAYDFDAMGYSRENPYLWRVKGNLVVSAQVALKGYVIFIVDGNTNFQANADVQFGGGKQESTIAFYANGSIDVASTVTVMGGQLFTNNDITFHGNPEMAGSIVVCGQVNGAGTPALNYLPASPALTSYWQPFDDRLKLLGYSER